MSNSRFGYSENKNSFKGLNIDCVQYSNIIRITYYSYSYSGTILNPNIIRIRIRPNICARKLFVFVFARSEKTNIIRIRIRSKSYSEYYSYSYSVQKTVFAHLWRDSYVIKFVWANIHTRAKLSIRLMPPLGEKIIVAAFN